MDGLFVLFFVVSALVQPLAPVLLAGALGLLALALGRRRLALGLLAGGMGLLLILALLPLGVWALRPLETRFPPATPAELAEAAGVLVLGGAEQVGISAATGQVAVSDAAERLLALGALARARPDLPIVYSGGVGGLRTEPGEWTGADVVRLYLKDEGLPEDRVRLDPLSRTTADHPRYVGALLGGVPEAPWLVVTSAFHMPRAVGVLRRAGWHVIPYPVDYRTRGAEDPIALRFGDNLGRLDTALHEWLGLAGYWAVGYTDTLFPAPADAP